MNIALIGGGGREHALCVKLLESSKVKQIYCVPGNAGTSKIAKNLHLDINNFNILYKTFLNKKIDLVVVGPEEPLVNGIVDFLEKKNIKVFGPNKYASQLEGSKAFMKDICKKNKIPTAGFKICTNKKEVLKFLEKNKLPIVVKANGLAAGKGVTICKTKHQIIKTCNEIFLGKFKSSRKLILEEFLEGEELSYFLIVDKNNFKFFGSAQDHKKVGENETGQNTGGMGAYSPAPILNNKLEKKIINEIIKPTLKALSRKKKSFRGFLYAGLMIKNKKPYLIEYNIRMGDPECQVIMPRLKTKLLDIIIAGIKNQLNKINIRWDNKKCMTVVLCSKGYPNKYKSGKLIKNLKKINLKKNSYIFHAGTKIVNNLLVSSGGRVLNIVSKGNSFFQIRKNIFKILKKINWKYGFFRKDIGWRVI